MCRELWEGRLTAGAHRRFLEADVLAYRGKANRGASAEMSTRTGV
jgi:hypothetical protein